MQEYRKRIWSAKETERCKWDTTKIRHLGLEIRNLEIIKLSWYVCSRKIKFKEWIICSKCLKTELYWLSRWTYKFNKLIERVIGKERRSKKFNWN